MHSDADTHPKVLFVGCNPTYKNVGDEAFVGTRSHKTLTEWTSSLGLWPDQTAYVNLIEKRSDSQKGVKKNDVDLHRFFMSMILKCIELHVGHDAAASMMVAKLQEKGRLDEQSFVALPEDELQANLARLKTLTMPKIVALGKMAEWGLTKLNIPYYALPHPSGLNRTLNDKEALKKSLEECKKWINEEVEDGETQGSEAEA